MQRFHTIDVCEMCGKVVSSQGVILSALCAALYAAAGKEGGGESSEGDMKCEHYMRKMEIDGRGKRRWRRHNKFVQKMGSEQKRCERREERKSYLE